MNVIGVGDTAIRTVWATLLIALVAVIIAALALSGAEFLRPLAAQAEYDQQTIDNDQYARERAADADAYIDAVRRRGEWQATLLEVKRELLLGLSFAARSLAVGGAAVVVYGLALLVRGMAGRLLPTPVARAGNPPAAGLPRRHGPDGPAVAPPAPVAPPPPSGPPGDRWRDPVYRAQQRRAARAAELVAIARQQRPTAPPTIVRVSGHGPRG